MQIINDLFHLMFLTSEFDKLTHGNSPLTLNWNIPKAKTTFFELLNSLTRFIADYNLKKVPLEPLVFVFIDNIYITNEIRLINFLEEIRDNFSHSNLSFMQKDHNFEFVILQNINYLKKTFELSQYFFNESFKHLELIEAKWSKGSFPCMVRELHPRKLITKHPWNPLQMESLRTLDTKFLVSINEDDPITGHRYFLGYESGVATGITIVTGHHRIYELYRRYINKLLEFNELNGLRGGDIIIQFQEAY
ncbi:MAG: hypothetical protein Q8Q35_03425 [Nanoarchaeota archaeon]|nr:hypothetical protein [Nanoarchaeota archaeon]